MWYLFYWRKKMRKFEKVSFEQFKKEQTENYEKLKDDKGFHEQMDKAKESLKGKNYDDFIKEAKE